MKNFLKDNVPTLPDEIGKETLYGFWKKGIDLHESNLLKRDELYRTNWFQITLPEYLYIHIPQNRQQFGQSETIYPYKSISDFVLTFANANNFPGKIRGTERIKTTHFLRERYFESPRLKKIIKPTNHAVIDLLHQAVPILMKARNLRRYTQSKKDIYYFPETGTKISLKRYKRGTIQLVGKKLVYQWHFAVGFDAILYPQPIYCISSHIIFTLQDQVVDKSTQHQLRRNMGANWWNKEWRDHLLGTLLFLAEDSEADFIEIPVSTDQSLKIKIEPIHLISKTGYLEPGEGN